MVEQSGLEHAWKMVQETYGGQRADEWNTVGASIEFIEGEDNQLGLLLQELVCDGDIIVEFGCGAGKLLAQCLRSIGNGTVIGVDLNRQMIARAADTISTVIDQTRRRILLIVSPIETCPLPENLAHVGFAKQVLHHVPDPVIALKQMARIIRHRGHLLVMVPGKRYQAKFFPALAFSGDPLGRFSQQEIEAIVIAAGLFPQRVYINRFRFWFHNLYDYLVFMDRNGATSKLLNYQAGNSPKAFVDA